MTDLKYFSTTKKGEIYELKAELNSDKKERKKEAVKKIIASMTVGKDVSALFPDVLNCIQTDNLELKKLVYLYLMNYAKTQPDLAILAVNTFVKDCEDANPLIRALAVRTMGCIRVEKITEYLCDPLRKCLRDEDPYVRKTAAVCVAKLHDLNRDLVEEQGFLEPLRYLISDSNPMVVSNAVAALSEISVTSPHLKIFELDSVLTNKLLTALNECSEWGQVFLLDTIANFQPRDEREAQSICERVTSRLAHANASVVLSAVKVLMLMSDRMNTESEFVVNLERKLAPPLVTLLSAEAEIQYVALRNINLILQKRPNILNNELRVFFVKYNDPIYVKLEKLEIMIRLTNSTNIGQVLSELKEYAAEVDVEFVRKSVRAIGRCAIKVEGFAEKCVSTLLDLIKTKVNYVVQESIVVIKDIFRKYPNRYEGIISTLCENLDSLDEPEARASMIWIIGEYAERIENSSEILGTFLDGFAEETNQQVQLQLLTAIVKTFLKKPNEAQHLVTKILQLTAEESDNPDLRDRGFIYWRLLSTDPQAARDIVLAEKPLIGEETDLLEPSLLEHLIRHIGSLASIYHKPPKAFVDPDRPAMSLGTADSSTTATQEITTSQLPDVSAVVIKNNEQARSSSPNLLEVDNLEDLTIAATLNDPMTPNLLDIELESILGGGVTPTPDTPSPVVAEPSKTNSALDDLFGLLGLSEPSSLIGGTGYDHMSSPTSLTPSTAAFHASKSSTHELSPNEQELWLSAEDGLGLEIHGTILPGIDDKLASPSMKMTFSNRSINGQTLSNFAMQIRKNTFRLCPITARIRSSDLGPGEVNRDVDVQLHCKGPQSMLDDADPVQLQVAVKNNIGVFYFKVRLPLEAMLIDEQMEGWKFINAWKDIADSSEKKYTLQLHSAWNAGDMNQRLAQRRIFTVSQKSIDDTSLFYQTMCIGIVTEKTHTLMILVELRINDKNPTVVQLSMKCENVVYLDAAHTTYKDTLFGR